MANDGRPRLRAAPLAHPPLLVLVDPEIPQNTGNVARLAAALQCPLHLVGRLGFRVDDKAVRRAGLDYWHLVQLERHLDFPHFRQEHPHANIKLFSAVGSRSYLSAAYAPGDALVFGRESTGLPDELLASWPNDIYGLPTIGPVRSLNLANAVSIVAYEAFRQLGAFAEVSLGD
jgi:tRNA (cytidine/uridine-2'-O-)-methyltransferase